MERKKHRAQCVEIIEQQGLTLNAKMDAVKNILSRVGSGLSELLIEKTNESAIQAQIDGVLTLLLSIQTNAGKMSALDLIQSNKAYVDDLIAHASAQERKEWEELMEQLSTPPTLLQKATDASQNVMSWMTAPIAAAYRTFAPTSVKKMVEDFLPSTVDSESKVRLKALAEARLPKLHKALEASQEKKELIVSQIVNENLSVKQAILDAATTKLEEILTTNCSVLEVITQYHALSTTILHNQNKLREAHILDENINKFIEDNGGFFVELSLFISKICSLFKTDIASKIEKIRTIKSALKNLKDAYEQAVDADMNAITNYPNHSNLIKNAVVAKLIPVRVEETQLERPPNGRKPIITFDSVQTLFNRFITPEIEQNIEIGSVPSQTIC